MDYLKAHPWPFVMPGPPSMAYTAHDHIVAKNIERLSSYAQRNREPSLVFDALKYMRDSLKDQVRRQAKGLLPGITNLPRSMRS
jgi:hypothetical protein